MSSTKISVEKFEELLPLAVRWVEESEGVILQCGVPLTASQLNDAQALGVAYPDRVRVLVVPSIPMPEHPLMQEVAESAGFLGPYSAGLSLRYGIFVRSDCVDDPLLIPHELVHTGQYERLGGIEPFLREYLKQCFSIGYPEAPLEKEAIVKAKALRKSGKSLPQT